MIPELKKPSKWSRKKVLTVNTEKWKFHMSEILFMGNLLSTWDIGPIQSKAEAVAEALKPETVAEVTAGSRPWDKEGRGCLQKRCYRPFGPQLGLKIRGGGGLGPSPGSAPESAKLLRSCKRLCQVQSWSSHSIWTETYHISGTFNY